MSGQQQATSQAPRACGPSLDGHRVRDLRYHAGLTQLDLAVRVGITKQAVSLIELGQRHTTRSPIALRLAAALGVPLDEIKRQATGRDLATTASENVA